MYTSYRKFITIYYDIVHTTLNDYMHEILLRNENGFHFSLLNLCTHFFTTVSYYRQKKSQTKYIIFLKTIILIGKCLERMIDALNVI